jgi:hypothetical protein
MNKILSTRITKYIIQKSNFLSIKSCTFARFTQKPTIKKVLSELNDNIEIPKDRTLDLDETTPSQNSEKQNFDMDNLDEIFGKDQNFSQKERHTMNSKKTSAKEAEKEDEGNSSQTQQY